MDVKREMLRFVLHFSGCVGWLLEVQCYIGVKNWIVYSEVERS